LGIPADDLSFSPIADFYALRSPDDPDAREGMLIIDFGAGVTEYVVFYDGGCMHSGQITVGCDHVANDLSLGLGISIGEARELFRTHAEVGCDPAKTGEVLKLPATLGHDPRQLRRGAVETIIDLRLRELFSLIRDELLAAGVLGLVGRRIELCGGGANLPGLTNLVREIFGIPCRVGLPGNVAGLPSEIATPQWVTPIGLLIVGNELRKVEQTGSLPLTRQLAHDAAQFFSLCRKAFKI
jgi:cell division protein FtsA